MFQVVPVKFTGRLNLPVNFMRWTFQDMVFSGSCMEVRAFKISAGSRAMQMKPWLSTKNYRINSGAAPGNKTWPRSRVLNFCIYKLVAPYMCGIGDMFALRICLQRCAYGTVEKMTIDVIVIGVNTQCSFLLCLLTTIIYVLKSGKIFTYTCKNNLST